MRNHVPYKTILGLMICLASAYCTKAGAAEENRFKGWIEENVFYRFDNQTGEIFKLVKPATGSPAWVKCDVVEPKLPQVAKSAPLPSAPMQSMQFPNTNNSAPAPVAPRQHFPGQSGSIIDPDAMLSLNNDQPVSPKPQTGSRQIELFDEFGTNITNKIDDSDRLAARPAINGYDSLHVSHTLKTTGDRISGIIILDNKGNRKIAMLELTMTVHVIGKDKPIEHKRFIFADKGDEKPPVPSFGSSGMSVLKKVDVPTPAGVINGMPEVRVTYIKFDDKE